MDVARSLASGMADARLAVLEGTSAGYALDDSQAVVDAVNEFLGEGEEPAAAARVEPPEASAFRTVLFTDVEGSTLSQTGSATPRHETYSVSTSASLATL